MKYDIKQSIEILERTPGVLRNLLSGISEEWVQNNEGAESWSPFVVMGHLVHGEKTDWITRTKIILAQGENRTFEPFDRFAQLQDSKGKTIDQLLDEFETLRGENLKELKNFDISDDQFDLVGIHTDLGEATLRQLLSTWTVHDLGHIAQICRVMAKQYKDEVGPWEAYIPILHR